jgi:hypothetical protein
MSDLVLDHERRREVSDAVGLSFSRARAVRRVARQPMSMGELAAALGIDRPNATVLVDDLEAQGLVHRPSDPTGRGHAQRQESRPASQRDLGHTTCCLQRGWPRRPRDASPDPAGGQAAEVASDRLMAQLAHTDPATPGCRRTTRATTAGRAARCRAIAGRPGADRQRRRRRPSAAQRRGVRCVDGHVRPAARSDDGATHGGGRGTASRRPRSRRRGTGRPSSAVGERRGVRSRLEHVHRAAARPDDGAPGRSRGPAARRPRADRRRPRRGQLHDERRDLRVRG